MIKWIQIAWQETKAMYKINILIYTLQFVLAFGIGMQVWQVMEASIGDSLLMDKLDNGFNRTIFEDFLQIHGASVTPLLGLIRWIVPIYMVLSIFLHAGLIYSLIEKDYSIPAFLRGGAIYFFPSAKIVIVVLLIMAIWTFLLLGGYFIIVGNPLEFFDTEVTFIWTLALVMLCLILGLIFLWMLSLVARIAMISQHNKGGNYIMKAWVITRQRAVLLSFWVLLGILLFLMVFLIYRFLIGYIPVDSLIGLVLIFCLQQIFNFTRVNLRTFLYSGLKNTVIIRGESSHLIGENCQ